MKFMKALGYVESQNLLGSVIGFSLVEQTVTLADNDGDTATFDSEDVEILEEVFTRPNGETVFVGDVYEIEGFKVVVGKLGTSIRLSAINESLEVVQAGILREINEYAIKQFELGNPVKLGNINVMQNDVDNKFDFNVKVVKVNDKYYYACNDKENEGIDLIKVVFIGAELLEEEYEREELDYDTYSLLLEDGDIVEVSPTELRSYAYNVMRKSNHVEHEEDIDEDEYDLDFEDDLEDEECYHDGLCEGCDCGAHVEEEGSDEVEEEVTPLDELGKIFSEITGKSATVDKEEIGKVMNIEEAQRVAQKIIKAMHNRV